MTNSSPERIPLEVPHEPNVERAARLSRVPNAQ